MDLRKSILVDLCILKQEQISTIDGDLAHPNEGILFALPLYSCCRSQLWRHRLLYWALNLNLVLLFLLLDYQHVFLLNERVRHEVRILIETQWVRIQKHYLAHFNMLSKRVELPNLASRRLLERPLPNLV